MVTTVLERFGRWNLAAMAMLALCAAIWMLPTPAAAQDRGPPMDFSEFHTQLDPHGEWISHPRYGEAWVPYANEDREWRPYSRGQWIYTDEHGWYWESDEPFGWATYHYGRWKLDDRYGWMWIPGHEWGPAWVSFRHGDEYVGWAPLPPEAEWDPYSRSTMSFDAYDAGAIGLAGAGALAAYWIFVRPQFMTAPRVSQHFFPPARNDFFLRQTRHVTHYESRGNRVFNRGIDVNQLQRQTGRSIPIMPVRGISDPRDNGRRSGERGHVDIYRPSISALPPGQAPRQPHRDVQPDDVRRVSPGVGNRPGNLAPNGGQSGGAPGSFGRAPGSGPPSGYSGPSGGPSGGPGGGFGGSGGGNNGRVFNGGNAPNQPANPSPRGAGPAAGAPPSQAGQGSGFNQPRQAPVIIQQQPVQRAAPPPPPPVQRSAPPPPPAQRAAPAPQQPQPQPQRGAPPPPQNKRPTPPGQPPH